MINCIVIIVPIRKKEIKYCEIIFFILPAEFGRVMNTVFVAVRKKPLSVLFLTCHKPNTKRNSSIYNT